MYSQLNDASTQAKAAATSFQENMQALKHNFLLRGFFNNRGYDDSTKLTEHELSRLPAQPSLKSFCYDVTQLFEDVNHAKLKKGRTLDEVGHFLETTPFALAVVSSAGGMKGDSAAVRVLTQARAMVVRDYLVNGFKMDDQRVKTMGLGKSGQVASDSGIIEILVYRQ